LFHLRNRLIYLSLMAISLIGLGLLINQSMASTTSCEDCHKSIHPTVIPVNKTSRCPTCHTDTNYNATHGEGKNMALIWTDEGSFYSEDSLKSTPKMLHSIHSSSQPGSYASCSPCHQRVSCTLCHDADCSACHGALPNVTFHTKESLVNGSHSVLGCSSCHMPNGAGKLRFINGTSTINTPEVCRQCHYSIYEDWKRGKHFVSNETSCTHKFCHDPHQPAIPKEIAPPQPDATGFLTVIISSLIIVGVLVIQAIKYSIGEKRS